MTATLNQKLDAVLFETTEPVEPSMRRYVARGCTPWGGWGVFDRHLDRFLAPEEVGAMELDDLRQGMPN